MKRVLITGARAPVALDLAHSFAAAGFEPHLADCLTPCAARLSMFGRTSLHSYAAPRHNFPKFVADLQRLTMRLQPALIIPVCEEVFALAAAAPHLSDCLVFAPDLDTLRRLHSKHDFLEFAAACGFTVPVTRRLTSVATLQTLEAESRRLVFKPEFSRFAARALLRPAAADLARIVPTPEAPWVAQEFVAGDELCAWSAAIDGRLVAYAAYQPRWRQGQASSYYFAPVREPALQSFCAAVAKAGKVTGQLAFDVIRTGEGQIVPLECNPRGTSGIHLFRRAPALARALMGEHPLTVPGDVPVCLGPAMALLGLPVALRAGQGPAFFSGWRRADDGFFSTAERTGALIDAARFAAAGLRHGRSAAAQSTADIEWNGETLG